MQISDATIAGLSYMSHPTAGFCCSLPEVCWKLSMKLPSPLKVLREAAAAARAAASARRPLGPPAGRGAPRSLLLPFVDACPLACGRPSPACLAPLSFLQPRNDRRHLLKAS